MAKVIPKKRGRPTVDSEFKKDTFLTLRLNEIILAQLEEVKNFLEQTKHLRNEPPKNKITLRDAINYLLLHGMTYYKQDRRRKADK